MEPDVLGTLFELGLTNAECTVYLAAIRVGGGTTREIAGAAEKERGNTHHTLEKLQRLGIVEATLDTPTTFKPMALADAIDHLFSLQAMKLHKLDDQRKAVAASLSSSSLRTARQTETYSIIKGRVSTYLRMVQTIQASSHDVLFLLSASGLTRLKRFKDFLLTMKEKTAEGVEFRMISEINEDNVEDAMAFAEVCELRHVRNQSTNASVYDGTTASVALSISEGLDEDTMQHVALWTNGKSFVRAIADYFDSVWFVAAPAEPTIQSLGSD